MDIDTQVRLAAGQNPKYYNAADYKGALIESPGCGDLAPSGGWINDLNSHGCWAVSGPTIPIGYSFASVQAAWEIVNAAFSSVSMQPAIANYIDLPGSFSVVA